MLSMFNIGALLDRVRLSVYWLLAMALAVSGLAPVFLLSDQAGAAQLTSRSVTISTSQASATGVDYALAFTLPSTTAVQSITLDFCTTPLGTCTLPTGMDVDFNTTSISAQTFSEATSFAEYTGADAGACTTHNSGATSTQYCATRTDTDAETAIAKALTIADITNPSVASVFTTVYVRINLFSDTAFATSVHSGTVAAGITLQLTVNGRVQERLDFCVSAIDDGGAGDTTLPTGASDSCSTIGQTTTTVDIGVIDDSAVQIAPVDSTATNGANDDYGIAMVKTNASGGVAVTFFAEQDAGGTQQLRSFRVDNATCSATAATFTDQCFRSADGDTTGGSTPTLAQEYFGMYVPCVDQGDGTRSTTTGLTVDTDFDGFDATTTRVADCENADKADNGGFPTIAWNDTGVASTIASSTGVIDDEVIKLSFAAQAASTTPTGFYTVVSTYIATPTF